MKKARKARGIVHETWVLPDLRRLVDLGAIKPIGSYPSVEEKAAMELAEAIHYSRSTDSAVSLAAQEEAQSFINTRGLAATLDEIRQYAKARTV